MSAYYTTWQDSTVYSLRMKIIFKNVLVYSLNMTTNINLYDTLLFYLVVLTEYFSSYRDKPTLLF